MAEVDRLLEAMRTHPADPRLATLDAAVMAGVAARRAAIRARRSMMLAAAVALGVGMAGSTLSGAPAAASPSPFGMSDYAPSRLLDR